MNAVEMKSTVRALLLLLRGPAFLLMFVAPVLHADAEGIAYVDAIGVPVAFVVEGADSSSTWAELPRRLEESTWVASSSTALLLDPRSTACRGSLGCTAHRLARLSVGIDKNRRPPVSVIIAARASGRELSLNLMAFSTNGLVGMAHAKVDSIPESAWDEILLDIVKPSVRVTDTDIAARIDRAEALQPTLTRLWGVLWARVVDIFVEEASRPSPVAALRLELPTVGTRIRIEDHPPTDVLTSQMEVTGLVPGVRRLEVSHPDYITLRRTVDLVAGPNTLAVSLEPRPSFLGRVSGASWATAGTMAALSAGAAALATARVSGTTVLSSGDKARTFWPRLVADNEAGQGPLLVPSAVALGVGAIATILVEGLTDADDRPAWLLPLAILGSTLVTYGAGELICWRIECDP
jgi:hypothetical protein